jgi:hypothetical protein
MFKIQHKRDYPWGWFDLRIVPLYLTQRAAERSVKRLSKLGYNARIIKIAAVLLVSCSTAIANEAPIIIPMAQQSTTTKLGGLYTTTTKDGERFYTTQLGSTTTTKDCHGNTWYTYKLGSIYTTKQQQK